MIIGTLTGSVDLAWRNDHWDLPHGPGGPERSIYAGKILVGWIQGATSDKFSAWMMTSQMGEMLGLYADEASAKAAAVEAITAALIS